MITYFKVNNTDLSQYVNEIVVSNTKNYNAQTNAAGNMVVDYLNTKRVIEVGFIPLDSVEMGVVQTAIANLSLTVSYIDAQTGSLTNVSCILPESSVDYYTIRETTTSFKGFRLKFIEL